MKRNCVFQIPRGETSRYVYIFEYKGAYYKVTLKVLLGYSYSKISVVNIPTKFIMKYINTVVATTY
jgi:hypothetical protein